MLHLFLDTNIYLDYFRLVSADKNLIPSLKRLDELVSSKKISLLLTEQVRNEYSWNRRKIAEETRKSLIEKSHFSPPGPSVLGKESSEVKKLFAAAKNVQEAMEVLIKKYDEQIENETTPIDKLLNKLFKKARVLPDSDLILERAHKRFMRGNPPRKSDYSYGDAIIWEILLEAAGANDLFFISHDSDYIEMQKGKKGLKTFLKNEWKSRTGKKITYCESLGEFINLIDKKETISKEVIIKEKLIGDLGSASSYYPMGMPYMTNTVLASPSLDPFLRNASQNDFKDLYSTSVVATPNTVNLFSSRDIYPIRFCECGTINTITPSTNGLVSQRYCSGCGSILK